jgi:hypothetical protein
MARQVNVSKGLFPGSRITRRPKSFAEDPESRAYFDPFTSESVMLPLTRSVLTSNFCFG